VAAQPAAPRIRSPTERQRAPGMAPAHALAVLLCALPVASLRSAASDREAGAAAGTPVDKVISLLTKLSDKISADGAKEAAEYDKFACFCKAEVVAKDHSITKSKEKIEKLDAEIEALDTDIKALEDEASELGKKIDKLKDDIKEEKKERAKERKKWQIDDANVTEAITAVKKAIDVLKDSKGDMEGAKLDLAQVRALASRTLPKLSGLPHAQLSAVSALLADASASGKPPVYTYRSNDIIVVLKELMKNFKKNKQDLYQDEFDLKAISDKKVLGWTNEKKFKEKAKLQKEAVADAKTEDMKAAEEDKEGEEKDQKADEAFLDELKSQCEKKAKEFDERSQARSDELTAINEANEILKEGVSKLYGANKKLVGLERAATLHLRRQLVSPTNASAHHANSSVSHANASVGHSNASVPVSFLQQLQLGRGAGSEGAAAAIIRRALQQLDGAASRLQSPILSALAVKASVHGDSFAKVRGLINDLIKKLEDEALAEADAKSFCDEEMEKSVKNRDDEKMTMEKEAAAITEKESEKRQLGEEIMELSEEVAELAKALNEATELRSKEKENNEKTLADAGAGKKAVEEAIDVLKEFYGDGSLIQADPPEGADRDGKTVKDRAPELSYEGEYKGQTGASKGVLGLLEVILADFERTVETVETAEEEAQKDFDDFEKESKDTMDDKKKEKEKKEKKVKEAEDAITESEESFDSAKKLHAAALEELDALQEQCVGGEESWEERKKKREKEIEALKDALKILEDWKS